MVIRQFHLLLCGELLNLLSRLCDVRFTSVKASINLSDVTVSSASGDFNATSLAHVINTETVNNMVVQTWLDRAGPSMSLKHTDITDPIPSQETRKSTLVFCVNLAHVRDLTHTFRQFGIDARYVHSGTPVAERRTLISSFKEGAFPILVNCGGSLIVLFGVLWN